MPASACPFAASPSIGSPSGGISNDAVIDMIVDGRYEDARSLQNARKEAYRQRLLASNGGEVLGITARSARRAAWVSILPEMSEPELGPVRLQFFDEDGFSGHRVCGSMDAALDDAVRDGYTEPDPMAMNRTFRQGRWSGQSAVAGWA